VSPTSFGPARRLLGTARDVAGAVSEPAASVVGALSPDHWGALVGGLSRRAATGPGARVAAGAGSLAVLRRAGLLSPVRPDRLVGMALSLRYGPSVAAGLSAAAARAPGRVAIIDDAGPLTYAEVARRTDALAAAYTLRGIGRGTAVGLLARNGRGFLEPMVALSKVGADVVLLNTGMAAPQLADVVRRERLVAGVADADLDDLLPAGLLRLAAEVEPLGRVAQPRPPAAPGRIVLLTSGTTGAPKGAARGVRSAGPGVAMLEAIPYQAGEPLLIASPMFHAWGLANLGLALLLGSTLVVRSRFDPETTLADIERHRVGLVAAVPVMLQRLVALAPEVRSGYDTSSLRAVAISGSALPATLAEQFQDAFGDVIYNLYGSTEVGFVTVAAPGDLRADPGTAGHVLRGVTVRIVDEDGAPVPDGVSGRIFVGSDLTFEGYTGGEDKPRLEGLVSSGDTGRFDAEGRLVIEGRDDDMIVSGGENVFPGEVEDVIQALPGVVEVAVLGVPDEHFGQRLVAFVAGDGSLDVDVVRGHVKAHLAAYKVPREVTFVAELPRNATGKVLKRVLVAQDAS
jgi:acyl-CoA synthetase (AMP-forming)/AMP-acid ligase II